MENIWSLTVRPIQLSLLTHLLITSCGVLSAEKHRLLEVYIADHYFAPERAMIEVRYIELLMCICMSTLAS